MAEPILSIRGLKKSFGALVATDDASLDVRPGEIHARIGSSADIFRRPPHRIARLGLGLAPEGRRCFPNLSVAENLLAAAPAGQWTQARVEALFPGLAERRSQFARTLSDDERQMLPLGRALTANPVLLVLDEAAEGLAPVIRQDIWAAIRPLKAAGQSILIVDKSPLELLPAADRCAILENGRSVWTGPSGSLGVEVRDRYLGL